MLRRIEMTESYSQISLKWHSCVLIVISQKSVVFEEKALELSYLEHFETRHLLLVLCRCCTTMT